MNRIPPDVARRIHHNYIDNSCETPDAQTHAVIISVKEAVLAMHGAEKGNQLIDLLNQIQFDTLVCYFGRYDVDDVSDKKGRNTVIVHLANTADDGSVTVIEDEIYNFGDLKPPKTPLGEQVF